VICAVKVSIQASCLTVSNDQKFFYVGFKYFGIVKKYSLVDYKFICSLVVNSGDVITMFEIWPGIIYTSGSDCTVRAAEMTSECKGQVAQLMIQPVQRNKMSIDYLLYSEMSEGISALTHLACAAGQRLHCKSHFSLLICQISKLSPILVRVRSKLTIEKLESASTTVGE